MRCRVRSAWRVVCGRCRSPRRRSCPVTSGYAKVRLLVDLAKRPPRRLRRGTRRSWSSRSRRCASTRSRSCWPAGGPWSTPPAKKNAPRASTPSGPCTSPPPSEAPGAPTATSPPRSARSSATPSTAAPASVYRAEKAEADANGEKVTSTAAQRRHDALLELLLQATAAGDAGNGAQRPRHHRRHRRHQAPRRHTRRDRRRDRSRHPRHRRRPRCAGAATPASPASSPDPTPPPSTSATPPDSPTAPNAEPSPPRDRGCTFPGCDRPPGWTSAHHLTHWIHGGPTSLWNLTLLCSFHHHRVHEGGFGLERLPNGELRFTRPDGTTLTVPKRRWNDAA